MSDTQKVPVNVCVVLGHHLAGTMVGIHLHKVIGMGDAAQVEFSKTLCGDTCSSQPASYKSFGLYESFDKKQGVKLCLACQEAHAKLPVPVLYCAAWDAWVRGVDGKFAWSAQPQEYFHATDEADARLQIAGILNTFTFRIVAMGPAIGFFVTDTHGEKLSAEKKEGI